MSLFIYKISAKISVIETGKYAKGVNWAQVGQESGEMAAQEILKPPVKVKELKLTAPKIKTNPFNQQVPGYTVMFLLFGVAGVAGSILEEKEKGTMARLLVAPLNKNSILAGKIFSTFATGLLQVFALFVFGYFVFSLDLGESVLALAFLIIATVFAATNLGLVLAALTRTRKQMETISTLIILMMSALGGSWWPLFIEPKWMQNLAHITLTAWAMDGFNDLMVRGLSLPSVLPEIGVLFIYGLICFLIGSFFLKFKE